MVSRLRDLHSVEINGSDELASGLRLQFTRDRFLQLAWRVVLFLAGVVGLTLA